MPLLRSLSGSVVAAIAISAATLATTHAMADEPWPTRPIHVISPFPPGSASDTTSREERGGIKVGPLGQCFDPRACLGYYGGYPGGYYAYGSVLPPRYYGYTGYNSDLDYY